MATNAADPIDTLLDEAVRYRDRCVAKTTTSPPDFTYTHITSYDDIENEVSTTIKVKDTVFRGRGLYASKDIKEGVHLIVAKPLVMVMSWEISDSDDDDDIVSEDELEDFIDTERYPVDDNSDHIKSADGELMDSDDDYAKREDDEVDQKDVKVSVKEDSYDEDLSEDGDLVDRSLPTGEKRNGLLILRLIDKIKSNPKLWTKTLSQLFPRDEETALKLPPWVCSCARIGLDIEQNFNELLDLQLFPEDLNQETCKQIHLRLPLIVRYNVLSVETAPEQYSHFDSEKGMVHLNGTALFGPEVSYLNHSHNPNLSRMSIGDVMFFVTNRNISSGDELCFSYIEHELLCENEEKRTHALDMDFTDFDEDDNSASNEASNKKQKVVVKNTKTRSSGPMIDATVQNEIMSTQPFERLDLIFDLLNNPLPIEPEHEYQCDKYILHSLHAITLDQLGRSAEALPEWQACIEFATKNFPPIDENTMNLHVQAALCAKKAKKNDIAADHASKALEIHHKLWGGGRKRFLKRYENDFSKPIRPISKKQIRADVEELFAK